MNILKIEIICFLGIKYKKLGLDKVYKMLVIDRDVNIFKVLGNLKN